MPIMRPILVAAALLAVPVSGCARHSVVPETADTADAFELSSGTTGRHYIITISRPPLPAPANGYPVLYVPADDAAFREIADTAQRNGKPALIVGIGYPPGVDSVKVGILDLTPSVSVEPPKGSGTGEAEGFLTFLERELKPEIARRFPVDRDNQTLFGQSCAGLFTLYTLVNAPASFNTFIALNPAIAFENRFLMEPQLRERLGPKLQATQATPRALLIAGEQASTDCPAAHDEQSTREFQAFLQSLPGISGEFLRLSGASGSAPEWVSSAVRYALAADGVRAAPAAKLALPGAPGGIAVPTAGEYRAMNAEQRYALRLRVRDLPEDRRKLWTQAFHTSLSAGLTYGEHRRFYEERVAMDQRHGTRSPDDR